MKKSLVVLLLVLVTQNTFAGREGGGGNLYAENFFSATANALENLSFLPEFNSVYEQANTIFENEPKLVFVDQLQDCNDKFIEEPGQYAYSCKGEIRLIKKYWKIWLANEFQAQAHIEKILHEVLRVTAFSEKRVTNDDGFATTRKILKVTDLLTKPNCVRSYKILLPLDPWLDSLKKGITSSSAVDTGVDYEISGNEAMFRCKIDIEFSLSIGEVVDELLACKALARKYNFRMTLLSATPIKRNTNTFVTGLITRKCIGSEDQIVP